MKTSKMYNSTLFRYSLMICVAMLLCSLQIQAQRPGRGERIESLKVAHISSRMNLDPQTAEKFWPIYNQYEAELQQVVQEKRRLNQADTRSAEDILEQEQKALDIKRKYSAQFLRVIDNNQLNQLVSAEKEFRQMLLRRSRRMEEGPAMQPGMGHRRNFPADAPRQERRMQQNPGRLQSMPRDNQQNAAPAPSPFNRPGRPDGRR